MYLTHTALAVLIVTVLRMKIKNNYAKEDQED